MATTYTSPGSVLKDMVRLLVHDNATGGMILSDEDILAIAAAYPDATVTNSERFMVAYEAAIALYAHWLRIASAQVGPLRIEGTRRAEAAFALARLLYNRAKGLPPDASPGDFRTTRVAGRIAPALPDDFEAFFSRTMPL